MWFCLSSFVIGPSLVLFISVKVVKQKSLHLFLVVGVGWIHSWHNYVGLVKSKCCQSSPTLLCLIIMRVWAFSLFCFVGFVLLAGGAHAIFFLVTVRAPNSVSLMVKLQGCNLEAAS